MNQLSALLAARAQSVYRFPSGSSDSHAPPIPPTRFMVRRDCRGCLSGCPSVPGSGVVECALDPQSVRRIRIRPGVSRTHGDRAQLASEGGQPGRATCARPTEAATLRHWHSLFPYTDAAGVPARSAGIRPCCGGAIFTSLARRAIEAVRCSRRSEPNSGRRIAQALVGLSPSIHRARRWNRPSGWGKLSTVVRWRCCWSRGVHQIAAVVCRPGAGCRLDAARCVGAASLEAAT